jgi:hypothetical protein
MAYTRKKHTFEPRRLKMYPHHDLFMRGDVYGEAVGLIERGPRKGFFKVKFDRSGKTRIINPSNFAFID